MAAPSVSTYTEVSWMQFLLMGIPMSKAKDNSND